MSVENALATIRQGDNLCLMYDGTSICVLPRGHAGECSFDTTGWRLTRAMGELVVEFRDALSAFRDAWWAWEGSDEGIDAAAGRAIVALDDEVIRLADGGTAT